MEKPKVIEVEIKLTMDESPDFSFLGSYTDKQSEWAIARWRGKYVAEMDDSDWEIMPSRWREYLYFEPYAGGEATGGEEYKKYGMQDYRRMEAYNRGDWHFLGVIAVAVVSYPADNSGRLRVERFTSSGIWGVESDADEHIKELANEELDDLEMHLKHFCVDMEDFDRLAEEAIAELDI